MNNAEFAALHTTLKVVPILFVDPSTGTVKLVSEAEAMRTMLHEGAPTLLQNLRRSLLRFIELEGVGAADKTYGPDDVAKVAGVSEVTIRQWRVDGILTPSKGQGRQGGEAAQYTFLDLFTAGVIGMARRQGIRSSLLWKLQPMLQQLTRKSGRT